MVINTSVENANETTVYITFRVQPFSRNIARSLLKEPKIDFFDTGLVKGDEGAKFENMTALCLLKHVYGRVDFQGRPYALHYMKTKEKKKVDFCIVNDDNPEMLIEVKRSDPEPTEALLYFTNKYAIPGVQLVLRLKRERQKKGVEIRRGFDYLKSLLI